MKIERLRKVLETHSKVKIFVLTEQFCLCGYVRQPQQAGESLRLRIGASVRVVLSSMEVIEESSDSGTLLVTQEQKVTRRLKTHQRHLENLPIPAEYFVLARDL